MSAAGYLPVRTQCVTLLHSAMLRLVLKVKHRTSSSFYIASCPPAQESSRAAGASSKEAPAQSMHQKAGRCRCGLVVVGRRIEVGSQGLAFFRAPYCDNTTMYPSKNPCLIMKTPVFGISIRRGVSIQRAMRGVLQLIGSLFYKNAALFWDPKRGPNFDSYT